MKIKEDTRVCVCGDDKYKIHRIGLNNFKISKDVIGVLEEHDI